MKKITFVLALLITTAAFAADAPKPSEKLKELMAFTGTAQCKGKMFKSDFGPEHATVATVTSKWILGNFWLDIRYVESKTAKNPMPFAGHGYWGYDEETKKFVSGFVDNMGGYQTAQSDGWVGDKLTWVGPNHVGGATYESRDVFSKAKSGGIHHTFEMKINGNWVMLDEEDCSKPAK